MDASMAGPPQKEELEKRLKELPMLPSGVGELMSLDSDADDFASRVRDLAGREPALAARLLSVANGAGSAPAQRITTLPEALNRLGARRVSTLITSFALMRVFVPTNEAQRNLWRHALLTAVAAQEIAGASTWNVDRQQAYVIGLLHDIGHFVMLVGDAPDLGDPDVPDWNVPQSLVEAERERCGTDHCELGWMAARSWRLPRELCEPIRIHHRHGSLDGEIPSACVPLVRTLQQADSLSYLILRHAEPLAGLEGMPLVQKVGYFCVCPTWGRPPLTAQALAPLLPAVRAKGEQQIAALGLGGVHA